MYKKEKRRESDVFEGLETRPSYIKVEYMRMSWGKFLARAIHYFLYTIFVSFWFYFVPWTSLILSYLIPYIMNPDYYDLVKN